jgi:hypothetical protein
MRRPLGTEALGRYSKSIHMHPLSIKREKGEEEGDALTEYICRGCICICMHVLLSLKTGLLFTWSCGARGLFIAS